MGIRHHLNDALLMGYSAGTLPEAFSLIVATHVSLCDDCRARLASFDAVGGVLVEEAEPASVSGACLAGALDLIRNAQPTPEARPTRASDPVLPMPLAEYVGGRLNDVKWRPVGMGVKQAILETDDSATARLLYIPAGTAIPDHGHRGLELTLVLQGAFEDEEGRFARGDIEIADEQTDHTPIADISQDCICLAVTDQPLRFKGLVPRILQPFLKI